MAAYLPPGYKWIRCDLHSLVPNISARPHGPTKKISARPHGPTKKETEAPIQCQILTSPKGQFHYDSGNSRSDRFEYQTCRIRNLPLTELTRHHYDQMYQTHRIQSWPPTRYGAGDTLDTRDTNWPLVKRSRLSWSNLPAVGRLRWWGWKIISVVGGGRVLKVRLIEPCRWPEWLIHHVCAMLMMKRWWT